MLHAEDENVRLLQFFQYELIIIGEKCLQLSGHPGQQSQLLNIRGKVLNLHFDSLSTDRFQRATSTSSTREELTFQEAQKTKTMVLEFLQEKSVGVIVKKTAHLRKIEIDFTVIVESNEESLECSSFVVLSNWIRRRTRWRGSIQTARIWERLTWRTKIRNVRKAMEESCRTIVSWEKIPDDLTISNRSQESPRKTREFFFSPALNVSFKRYVNRKQPEQDCTFL